MKLEELLKQKPGSVIELKNGERLFIEDNDFCEGDYVCYGAYSNKPCYFLKNEHGAWNHQNCPGSNGNCHHCYIKLEKDEPRPQYYVESGSDAIANERKRQVLKEGWTSEHDAEHNKQELIKAAKCYIEANLKGYVPHNIPTDWPWDACWWKPECDSESIKNLKRAGALIAAEIDRLNKVKEFEIDAFEED